MLNILSVLHLGGSLELGTWTYEGDDIAFLETVGSEVALLADTVNVNLTAGVLDINIAIVSLYDAGDDTADLVLCCSDRGGKEVLDHHFLDSAFLGDSGSDL